MAKIKGVKAGKGKIMPVREEVAHAAPEGATPEFGGEGVAIAQSVANYGAAKVVELSADDKAILGMKFAPFKVEIIDIDVVLVFADGSKIVIPGMALAAFSGRKPLLVFDDREISAEQAVATVGEIKEQDVPIKLALSSADSDNADNKSGGKDKESGHIQPGDSAATQNSAAAQEANQHKSDEDARRLTEKISNTPPASSASPGVISARAVTPSPDDALGPAGIGKLVPQLKFTLYNKEGVTTGVENGQTAIKGSTGGATSSKDAAYGAQSGKETINGTSGDDIIYADNPAQAPSGTTLRTLHVEAMVPSKGLTLNQFLIPSLPPGYAIANGTLTPNGWLVTATDGNITKLTTTLDANGLPVNVPASQSMFTFDIQLIYTLPTEGKAANSAGFQDEFFLPVQLGLSTDGVHSSNSVEVSTHFGIKIVNAAGDMVVTDPVSGDPIYVLFSNPPGNVINAGDGNDRIVAGAGEDHRGAASGD